MKLIRIAVPLCTLCLFLPPANLARAQSADKKEEVSAGGDSEGKTDVIRENSRSATVSVISRAAIEGRGYESVHEVLKNGGLGSTGEKIRFLVNGRDIGRRQFKPDEIDRIEIIRGPGAALWGPNAADGVINIVTRATEYAESTAVVIASEPAANSPTTGNLIVNSKIQGYVFLNGENTGKLTPATFSLPPGDYEVVVVLRQTDTRIRQDVAVKAGKSYRLQFKDVK